MVSIADQCRRWFEYEKDSHAKVLAALVSVPKHLRSSEAWPDIEARLKRIKNVWSGYLALLEDADLARSFEYRSQEGEWYRNSIQDILTQLFGHSLYHRGQISALVRSMGCDPAATDFVFWTRQLIPDRASAPAPQEVDG